MDFFNNPKENPFPFFSKNIVGQSGKPWGFRPNIAAGNQLLGPFCWKIFREENFPPARIQHLVGQSGKPWGFRYNIAAGNQLLGPFYPK